ncbi:hypothetical protein DRF59_06680 [Chryseobacterium flavum]|uniref:Uncharacterized protein n=1 Tax=Chryseobacterium flavum TaxID=415851 RepID=A0A3D9CQN7_9FLAO|nr:hypothetical protein [Chryseobacterium flavum]REC67991.1 hypothetical protein DRF59_06680 [Chryseobacterium flavum]
MDFLQWLQDALMEHLDDLQLMVQLWLDRRSLRHSCLANTKKSKHTGGALKNQSVTEDLTLPPGQYTLHYNQIPDMHTAIGIHYLQMITFRDSCIGYIIH